MTEDQERRQAIKEFYRLYRIVQKRKNLRMHSRFSLYDDGLIEIWEYNGDTRGKRICKVEEENEADCYKRAAEAIAKYAE